MVVLCLSFRASGVCWGDSGSWMGQILVALSCFVCFVFGGWIQGLPRKRLVTSSQRSPLNASTSTQRD